MSIIDDTAAIGRRLEDLETERRLDREAEANIARLRERNKAVQGKTLAQLVLEVSVGLI